MQTINIDNNISCSIGLASHVTRPSFLYNIPDAGVIVGISLTPLIGARSIIPNTLGYAAHIHIRDGNETVKTYSEQELADFVQQAASTLDISALTQSDQVELECTIHVNMAHEQYGNIRIWYALIQFVVSPDIVAANAIMLEQQLEAYKAAINNAAASAASTTKH